MLTDESISPNIMPGLCKTLEKYILIYQLDAVMKLTGHKILSNSGKLIAGSLLSKAGFLAKTKKESADMVDEATYFGPKSKGGSGKMIPDFINPLEVEKSPVYMSDLALKRLMVQAQQPDAPKNIQALVAAQAADLKSKIEIDLKRQQAIIQAKHTEMDDYYKSMQFKEKSKEEQDFEKAKNDAELQKWSNERDKFERDKKWTTIKNVFDTIKAMKDIGTINVDMPRNDSLSIEPTYFTTNTVHGPTMIGIKVIPIPVQSKEGYSLAEMMTYESSLSYFDALLTNISRRVIRFFWAVCRGLRVIPLLSDRVVTGDPKRDILWASTYHKKYVFALLNYADLSSDFFRNVGGVHKLHTVGWNSFIIADEANKKAIFCMEEFHGLCSAVPYQFIYSSLGSEHSKVYDKLEDVRKSMSPIFRTTTSITKLAGKVRESLDHYLNRIS
jgi:Skp family chaperone for outer membrane proteins